MLKTLLKVTKEDIGTKIWVRIYHKRFKHGIPVDSTIVWEGSLSDAKSEFRCDETWDVVSSYPSIGGGFNGNIIINIFVKRAKTRKEAA